MVDARSQTTRQDEKHATVFHDEIVKRIKRVIAGRQTLTIYIVLANKIR